MESISGHHVFYDMHAQSQQFKSDKYNNLRAFRMTGKITYSQLVTIVRTVVIFLFCDILMLQRNISIIQT